MIKKKIDTGLFLKDFEVEAKVHIKTIEDAFLDISRLSGDSVLLNNVFRAAHSLKGTAAFFSLDKIVAVAHELENVMSGIRNGESALTEDIVDIVLRGVDCLRELTDNLHDVKSADAEPTGLAAFTEGVKQHANKGSRTIKARKAFFDLENNATEEALRRNMRFGHKIYQVHINFDRSLGQYYERPNRIIDNFKSVGNIIGMSVAGNTHMLVGSNPAPDPGHLSAVIIEARNRLDTTQIELLVTSVLETDLFSIAVEVNKQNIELLHLPEKAKQKAEAVKKSDAFIHLDIAVINELMDLANEMILTRNQLLSAASLHKKEMAGLMPVMYDINRLTSEIQEKVMLTRMQPIGVVFDKFPRIIRDVSKKLGKDAEAVISGSNVTLDKYLLDALTDPITQIVKNSADHGIESPEQRAKAGKPPKSKIMLNAYMRDNSAIIEIKDDGAGINTEALGKKAVENGIITEEALTSMSLKDIYNLMFEPGLSTAKILTDLSGRGIGMDIVKANIERLGGTIEIESERGTGTTTRLKMPLTLSVINALIVTIGGVSYAVPEINAARIVRVCKDSRALRAEQVSNSLVLSDRGKMLPIITMECIDAKARGEAPPSIKAVLKKLNEQEIVKYLLMKTGNKVFALLIDEAVESEQTLVQPLPVFLRSCPCYSGVTVLGNGNAVAILDADGIANFMDVGETADMNETAEHIPDAATKQIILFKCSGSEYYALETSRITRIETISGEQIQTIGKKRYVNVLDTTIRILRPESYAPVVKRTYKNDKLYVLTLKGSKEPLGLLAGKIIDKVEGVFDLDTEVIKSDFIHGTDVLEEKVVIFLNPDVIIEEAF